MNNQENLNEMRDKGYSKDKIKITPNFLKLIKYVKSTKFEIKNRNEKSGYSNDIFNLLPLNLQEYLNIFSEDLLKQKKWIKNYIFLPRLLSIQLLITNFDENIYKNPTHAMLWHRDADDINHHLKVQIPMCRINLNNGVFSCVSKSVCSLNHKLVDKTLYEKSFKEKDDYRVSDKIRVTDKMMYKYFKNQIFDFTGDVSDVLYVDTNYCYHRGGLILKPEEKRILLTITYGGFTHSWNKYFLLSKLSFIGNVKKFLARVLKFFKKIYLISSGGVRNIPIILK